MKLVCVYKVMFQYRVPTYEAISNLDGIEFELIHGASDKNTKLKNYSGEVYFKHTQLPTYWFRAKTNNGKSSQQILFFLFFNLIRKNPDILFVEGAASSLFTAIISFVYAKLFKKKIIWWSMGKLKNREYTGFRKILEKFIKHLDTHGDAIFTYSSQGERYFIEQGVAPNRIFKAVNVIDTTQKIQEIKDNLPIEKLPGFNICFVGAINKTKNIELLVDVILLLSQKYDDIKLHIIGDGNYLSNIKSYVKECNVEKNVLFYGRVVNELNVLMSKFSVLVLPGLGGLAIVDGMISSLPIISGLADGTELDLIDASNGFVTDKIDKEYLFNKLCYMHDNPNELDNMGINSFKKITGEYSFNNYMRIFQKCLKFVLDEK